MESSTGDGQHVQANGIDIHYREIGSGPPLILLHGGVVSTSDIWAGAPIAYTSHMETLARHFRVIAPDTRGGGRTRHASGEVTFSLLAEDVLALIGALGLDRPMLAGFSEGGITAAIVAIHAPGSVRAIVNHAGYDFFNPQAPSFAMMRQMLGGSPQATRADPDAAARSFSQSGPMSAMFDLMREDQDRAQGTGYWRTYIDLAFPRLSRSPGYTFEDLRKVDCPALILVGDRDGFCSCEEAVTAYRALTRGELAIVPNEGHAISGASIEAMTAFLVRHASMA